MIRALVFDVQGTLVDFHEPLMRLGAGVSARKGLDLDWAAFAKDWRGLYRDGMDAINDGRSGFVRVDVIYRRALDQLLEARGLGDAFSPPSATRSTRCGRGSTRGRTPSPAWCGCANATRSPPSPTPAWPRLSPW